MNETSYNYDNDLPIDSHEKLQTIDYYDLFKQQFLISGSKNETSHALSMESMLRAAFALVSRIGFIFVEVGNIPVENVYTIILYNIIEISVVLLAYGLIGNWFAFGPKTASGWISYGGFGWSFAFKSPSRAIIGFCGCLIATAQMSTFLVGRMNLAGGIFLNIFYCGLFQPLLIHWVWHERGWMRHSQFLEKYVAVKDYAGDLVFHIPSVIFGSIGALFLGRRMVRLKDLDSLSFGTENAVNTVVGYVLIITGYIIFALPAPFYEDMDFPENYHAIIITNSLLGIGGGIFIVTIIQLIVFRHINRYGRTIRCIQGGVAGIISLAAAVDVYTPIASFLLSLGAGFFFFFFAEIFHNTALEDSCSLIASHLVTGFIGIMLSPLLAQRQNLGSSVAPPTLAVHFLWQFLCTLVIISISIIIACIIFAMLKVCGILRNKFDVVNHKRANIIRDTTKRSCLERLLIINRNTDRVEPGYRKKYFDWNDVDESNAVPVSHSTDKNVRRMGINQEAGGQKEFDTVMHFKMEPFPVNTDAQWQLQGSGDHFDESKLEKPINDARETETSSNGRDTFRQKFCSQKIN